MSEINNNDMLKHFQSLAQAQKKQLNEVTEMAEKNAEPVNVSTKKSLKDLGNIPAETIGRSQVSKADNLVNDMKVMRENPRLVLRADEFFDYTLNQYVKEGKQNAYEEACLATARFINEFSKK